MQSALADLTLKQPFIVYTINFLYNFLNQRSLLLNNVSKLAKDKLLSSDTSIIKLFLYGDDSLYLVTNNVILNASVDFILSSKRWPAFIGLLYMLQIIVLQNYG